MRHDPLNLANQMICDFKFRWCAPCKGLTSRLDAIIGEKDGLLELAKVDVDINPELAMEYEVSIDLALGHTLFLGRSIFGHFISHSGQN